jgi:hypothetical protein
MDCGCATRLSGLRSTILHNEPGHCKSFVRLEHQSLRRPTQIGFGDSLVRQFERKEEMRAYSSDLERLPNERPQLEHWPVNFDHPLRTPFPPPTSRGLAARCIQAIPAVRSIAGTNILPTIGTNPAQDNCQQSRAHRIREPAHDSIDIIQPRETRRAIVAST